jgi:hypothetical protein
VSSASPSGSAPDSEVVEARRPVDVSSRWIILALVVGYVLHVLWRVWLTRHLDAPAAHADEDGYLVAARALVGGPGGATTENEAFRRLGYPLLLSPVYLFTSDAFAVYRGALLINALVGALVFPLAYLFGTRVVGLPRLTALGAGFVAAAMPAVVFYSEFALTDGVLAPIIMAWLLSAYWWLTAGTGRRRLLGAVAAGASAGFFYAVHARGVVIAFVHVILLVAVVVLRRSSWKLAAASLAAAVTAAAVDPALKWWIRGAIETLGRSPEGQTIDALTSVRGLFRMVLGADGQVWYLTVGTLGLGAVGLITVVAPLRDRRALRRELAEPQPGARRIVLLMILLTTVLIALSSSAALPPTDNRINYFAYPRYTHMLYPAWFLIGLAAVLAAWTVRRTAVLVGAAAAVITVTGAVVYLRINLSGWAFFLPFDAPEIMVLGWRWDAIGIIRPSAVAIVILAAIAFSIHRFGRAMPFALAGVLLLQAVTMVLVTARVSEPMVDPQYTADTPRIVADGYVRPGDKVAFGTTEHPTWYTRYNHMREVYWTRLMLFDQTTQDVPTGADVVIAPFGPDVDGIGHWDGTQHGFHLEVVDRTHSWAVWRRN